MRYLVERTNGVIEYVEADSFHVQDIGSVTSVLGGKMGGTAHYVFRTDPKERYGSGTNVAAFTDVLRVRIAPVESGDDVPKPSEPAAMIEPASDVVN